MLLFGVCFGLHFMKLSAGKEFFYAISSGNLERQNVFLSPLRGEHNNIAAMLTAQRTQINVV